MITYRIPPEQQNRKQLATSATKPKPGPHRATAPNQLAVMEKKGAKAHAKPGQEVRRDRRSATGMSGAPKKGGHGGKFTWAGDQRYAEEEDGGMMEKGALDARDPNFEDPEEQEGAAPAAKPEGAPELVKAA